MAEIWYDPDDGQVYAVYSGRYPGKVWSDRGLTVRRLTGALPSWARPGANVQEEELPPGDADADQERLADLNAALVSRDLDLVEVNELLRLRRTI